MRDQWLDRETAELDSLDYWEEAALDNELIKLWEAAQEKDKEVQAEVDALIEQGSTLVF